MKKIFLIFLISVWFMATLSGFFYLEYYANSKGAIGDIAQIWPHRSSLSLFPNALTGVFFLHPQCPCSRASVNELNSLMAHSQRKMKVYAVFIEPQGVDSEFTKTSLWRKTKSIPGVVNILDKEGAESKLFGALTSGHLFIYGKDRQLGFQGGLTASRGHEGDSAGKTAAIDFALNGAKSYAASSPVFGCELFNNAYQRISKWFF